MISKIDWISFTFAILGGAGLQLTELWDLVNASFKERCPATYETLIYHDDFKAITPRAPYRYAMQSTAHGIVVFCHPDRDEVLVEISGVGCGQVYGAGMMTQILREAAERATRIDIASDIHTDIEPSMFASDRLVLRTKSHSEFVSGSGETCYVGSRKSDRYARVYRYYPPHPRSHMLRVEHVLKAEQARQTIPQVLEFGIETIVAQLGNTFGWQHPVWQPWEVTDEKLAAWRPERRNASTVRWIYAQCLPAIAKLIKDGTLMGADITTELARYGVDILA